MAVVTKASEPTKPRKAVLNEGVRASWFSGWAEEVTVVVPVLAMRANLGGWMLAGRRTPRQGQAADCCGRISAARW